MAAMKKYGAPLIVLDFGTATTVDAVGADGVYMGEDEVLHAELEILKKYEGEHAHMIELKEENHDYQIIRGSYLDLSKGNVRHNSDIIAHERLRIVK